MKNLIFADTEEFYEKLLSFLKSGEEIEVITDYQRFSDLPPRLKQIFELEKYRTGTWVNVATAAFIPSSVAPVGLDYKVLIVLGGAGAGAGIGALFANIPGAIVGGVIGLAAGTIGAVFIDNQHQAEVEIDRHGKLNIKVSGNKNK